jgi:hypothetical protein
MPSPYKGLVLIDKLMDKLRTRAELQQAAATAQLDHSKLSFGFVKEPDKEFLLIPGSLINADIALSSMIVDLTRTFLPHVDIRVFDAPEIILTSAYDEKFINGLWFGTYSDIIHKRIRSKRGFELGQTEMQSLLVKHFFQNHRSLGPQALVKDNFFFGNNSGEKGGVMDLRLTLKSDCVPFIVRESRSKRS